jgi:hypothetical protein
MILAEIPENILRLLTVMKLDTIFLISPTEQDASERLSLIK